jgi:hypothetical protein
MGHARVTGDQMISAVSMKGGHRAPSVPPKHLLIKNDAFSQHSNGPFGRHAGR